jgi:hypothetical protein
VDQAVRLAQRELRDHRFAAAAAVCRVARRRFGEAPELMRIMSLSSSWLRLQPVGRQAQVEIHVALGEFHEVCGDRAQAGLEYGLALEGAPNTVAAHLGLARLRMPGPDYVHHLELLHQHLRPKVYLEIGVAKGQTLALARPPTVAIGVDPQPVVEVPMAAETHVYATTSDDFFAGSGLERLLGDRRVGMAFIDGLHHFDQALRDFAGVERWSDRDTVILVHDTYPLDEITQRRERETDYWTGDVWRFVACLREFRPALDIFTIATPPSGLTVIRGLDPRSSVISDKFVEFVDRYLAKPFLQTEPDLERILRLVPNDWAVVSERLAAPAARPVQ